MGWQQLNGRALARLLKTNWFGDPAFRIGDSIFKT